MRPAALRNFLLLAVLAVAQPANAIFHLYEISEIYSNADGSVQFIEFEAITGGQQFLAGHTLVATSGGSPTHTFTFPSNLPGDTAGRRFLVGTTGFAALGVVAPDYTVPNGFLSTGGGTINFGEGAVIWNYPAMPTNGTLSLNRNGSTGTNSPRNFAGNTGSIVPVATADFNVQGLWYASPAESESGWGINLVQQFRNPSDTILFVTWFTYGADGNGMWLVMSEALRTAPNTYTGTIYQTRGPAFNAVPFNPALVTRTEVGSGTLTFTGANNGTFAYNVGGVTQTKAITRQIFGNRISTCNLESTTAE